MDHRLKRTVATLLAGGVLLVAVGLMMVHNAWPDPFAYQVDGLTNGMPVPTPDEPSGLDLGLLAGGVVAVGGAVMAMTGAVATGVWLAGNRGGDRG